MKAKYQIYTTCKPFALRCPRYNGDNKKISENYKQKLQETLGIGKIIIADQVHSDICVEITQQNKSIIFEADALYTREKNVALFVLASDCVPILFFDPKNHIVGAIHAGRIGLEKNIIQKTFQEVLQKYAGNISDFKIYIGAHICQSCYEVGEGEVTNFRAKYPTYIQENKEKFEKYFLDIGAIALKQIQDFGVLQENIDHSGRCTYEESKLFHSYRRKTHNGEENYGNNGFGIFLC